MFKFFKRGNRRRTNYYNSNVKKEYLLTCPPKLFSECASERLSKSFINNKNLKLICRIIVLYAQCYSVLYCLKNNDLKILYPTIDAEGFLSNTEKFSFNVEGFRYMKKIITTYMLLPISQYIDIYIPSELFTFNNKNNNIDINYYKIRKNEVELYSNNECSKKDSRGILKKDRRVILIEKIYYNYKLICIIKDYIKFFDDIYNNIGINENRETKSINKKIRKFILKKKEIFNKISNKNIILSRKNKLISLFNRIDYILNKRLNNINDNENNIQNETELKNIFKLFIIDVDNKIEFITNKEPHILKTCI